MSDVSKSEPQKSKIPDVFLSASFLEKLVLLLVTALISGLLVPLVVKSIEATRARNNAILEAQTAFLDDISETILTLETLILDISFYGKHGNTEMQEKAFERLTVSVFLT